MVHLFVLGVDKEEGTHTSERKCQLGAGFPGYMDDGMGKHYLVLEIEQSMMMIILLTIQTQHRLLYIITAHHCSNKTQLSYIINTTAAVST